MVVDSPRLIIVSGPTCSGKSSLGIELAQRLEGEIINADSMQVYRGMDIGTAKVPVSERKGIPHHVMDIVDPDEAFNAALFLFKCRRLGPTYGGLSVRNAKGKVRRFFTGDCHGLISPRRKGSIRRIR